jgi:hypothetical protein
MGLRAARNIYLLAALGKLLSLREGFFAGKDLRYAVARTLWGVVLEGT